MTGKEATFVNTLASMFDRHERTIVSLYYGESLNEDEIATVLQSTPEIVGATLDSIRARAEKAIMSTQPKQHVSPHAAA
ncbi:MAG: hypothetical protein ACR2GY_14250 [Phycisphaerales bacterium]